MLRLLYAHKLIYKWFIISLWIMSTMCVVVIEDGKTNEAIFVLELRFFEYLVEELSNV